MGMGMGMGMGCGSAAAAAAVVVWQYSATEPYPSLKGCLACISGSSNGHVVKVAAVAAGSRCDGGGACA